MKRLLPWLSLLVLLYAAPMPRVLADPEVIAVIVNPGVHETTLSADQLEALFTLSQRTWNDGQAAIPFNYDAGTELRDAFDHAVLRMDPDAVARFWIDRRIRGLGDAPRKAPSVALMLRVVAKLPGAIGYVPIAVVTKDVRVVALVKNGKILPPPAAAAGAR